jgi:hypothetical protein
MSVKVLVRSSNPFSAPNFDRARAAVAAAHLSSTQVNEAFSLLLDLLRPASLIAFLLAAWRLSADLGWTNAFLFREGFLYHWQVWMALGFAMLGARQYFSTASSQQN